MSKTNARAVDSIPEGIEKTAADSGSGGDIDMPPPGPAKAIPEHMRRISGAVLGGSGSGVGRPSIDGLGGKIESKESVNLHGQRRSSIFSTDMAQQRMSRDRGMSIISMSDDPMANRGHAKVLYENTYIMEPSGYINLPAIREMILKVLEEKLKDAKYNIHMMGFLIRRITETLKDEVKKLGLKRYKVVCTAAIYQNIGQGIYQSSRFLWNDKADNWVDAVFVNPTIIAHGTVYMAYYE